jgi:hypothetical protein
MQRTRIEVSLPLPLIGIGSGIAREGAPTKENARREQQMRPHIRYLGFRTTDDGREYTLRATGAGEPRLFVMTIPHHAFATRQARFQDAPDLCCAKLTRVLAGETDDAQADARQVFTVEELLEYRVARTAPSSGRKRGARRADGDAPGGHSDSDAPRED